MTQATSREAIAGKAPPFHVRMAAEEEQKNKVSRPGFKVAEIFGFLGR